MSSSFFCMFAFVSRLLSNTVIMLFMFIFMLSLKAVTNNQPQVWISCHKLLDCCGIHDTIFTTVYYMCIFSLSCNFISLYLMFNYCH